MRPKRCFIISPIGSEASQSREHANDVLDFIIQPALEECGITAVRSDNILEPGRISEQMFQEILEDDLCIALLTGYNPNVFYELAIAQASARPLIVLLEKGLPLPFDIQDLRCVYYDLKPRPLHDQVYVKEIVEHVKSLESIGWVGNFPFGSISPLGGRARQDQLVKVYNQRLDVGGSEVWLQMLHDTQNVFEIMGISVRSWRSIDGFVEALTSKAASGCKIRVLLMDKDNPALRQFVNDAIKEVRFADVVRECDEMYDYFSELAAHHEHIQVTRVRRGCTYSRLTITDNCVIYDPYFYSTRSEFGPVWSILQQSPIYKTFVQEFESLWQANNSTIEKT